MVILLLRSAISPANCKIYYNVVFSNIDDHYMMGIFCCPAALYVGRGSNGAKVSTKVQMAGLNWIDALEAARHS